MVAASKPEVSLGRASISLMSVEEKAKANPYMLEFINYRKSGLSLNHVIGCPLECGYCVRHFWGNWDMKTPQMICSDDEAVDTLVNHRFFTQHKTPIQLFNKATDPFLPGVKPHTHYVLQELDRRGLTNMVLVITRAKVTEEDMRALETLKHVRVSLFFTYSGITDSRIEPIAPSNITVRSIELAARMRRRTKVILYWRPIVPGWNDDDATMLRVLELGKIVDAIVFTGYYHREENARHLQEIGVSVPYEDFQRRKIMPAELDEKVVRLYQQSDVETPLFRKTSCGACYAHAVPDYNGHWGVRELCDICPPRQRQRCAEAYRSPTEPDFEELLGEIGYETDFLIDGGHVWTRSLGEERRYHIQHTLGYQIWDIDWPHFKDRHGRAPTGHSTDRTDMKHYAKVREKLHVEQVMYEDD